GWGGGIVGLARGRAWVPDDLPSEGAADRRRLDEDLEGHAIALLKSVRGRREHEPAIREQAPVSVQQIARGRKGDLQGLRFRQDVTPAPGSPSVTGFAISWQASPTGKRKHTSPVKFQGAIPKFFSNARPFARSPWCRAGS